MRATSHIMQVHLFNVGIFLVYLCFPQLMFAERQKIVSMSTNDKDVFVTLPFEMFMFVPNVIRVHTNTGVMRIKLSTQPAYTNRTLDDPNTYVTIPDVDGWSYATIKYRVPFYDPDPGYRDWHKLILNFLFCREGACSIDQRKTLHLSYLVHRTVLSIWGELEKNYFRHGERVRARFIVLTAEQLPPFQRNLSVPIYRIEKHNDVYKTVEPIYGSTVVPLWPNFTCSLLQIRSPNGLVWKEEKKIPAHRVMYFEHDIRANDTAGIWVIELNCLWYRRTISFTVLRSDPTDILTYMVPPSDVHTDTAEVPFRVCARYRNGWPVITEIQALLCLCRGEGPLHLPFSKSDSNDILENKCCLLKPGAVAQRCAEQTLRSVSGCVNFRISTNILNFPVLLDPLERYHVQICYRVTEVRTNQMVTRCEYSKPIQEPAAKLLLESDLAYRIGIPYHIVAKLKHPALIDLEGQDVHLEVRQVLMGCQAQIDGQIPIEELIPYYFQATRKTSINGTVVFVLPPVHRGVYLTAVASIPNINRRKLIHDQVVLRNYKLHVEKNLKPWASMSESNLQVWLGSTGRLQAGCNQKSFSIQLLANRPLHNKTIWMETILNGEHVVYKYKPSIKSIRPTGKLIFSKDDCIDRDDVLGHYVCINNGMDDIVCRAGWQGENCLQPVCAEKCHPVGGWCTEPGGCECKFAWRGVNCTECIRCTSDDCRPNEKCMCEISDVGFFCKMLWSISKLQVKKARRTIFGRNIELPIHFKFGRGAHLMFYYYDTSTKTGKPEMITANAFLEATPCNPHSGISSLAVKSTLKNAVQSTTFHPVSNLKSDDNGDCYIRITPTIDHPGQKINVLDWETYMERVDDMWGLEMDFPRPVDTHGGFISSGLIIFSLGEIGEHNANSACPTFTVVGRSNRTMDVLIMDISLSTPKPQKQWDPKYPFELYEPVCIFNTTSNVDTSMQMIDGCPKQGYKDIHIHTYCTTKTSGLQIDNFLLFDIPWLLRASLREPLQAVQGEVTHMRVKLETALAEQCGEVRVELFAPKDVLEPMTASTSIACLCSDEIAETVFGVRFLQMGYLNVSIKAKLYYNSSFCGIALTHKELYGASAAPVLKSKLVEITENQTIYVSGPSLTRQVSYPVLICHPEDPSLKLRLSLLDKPNMFIPSTINPVNIEVMCSLTVFPLTLAKLHMIDSFDMILAEQIAMNMISLSWHVLYLQSEHVKAIDVLQKQMEPLRGKLHMLYEQLRRFKHSDGSYSNYGTQNSTGSVWITTLVLRALKLGSRTGYYSAEQRWDEDIIELLTFLEKAQNRSNGCFEETGQPLPTLMHGVNGRLTPELHSLLLTAYVTIGLREWPLPPMHYLYQEERIDEMVSQSIPCLTTWRTQGVTISTLSNYALSIITYAILVASDKSTLLVGSMLTELQSRVATRQSVLVGGSSLIYLTDTSNDYVADCETNSVAMEASAYLYLIWTKKEKPRAARLSIIKYLVSYFEWEADTRITQAATLVQQALVQFMMTESIDMKTELELIYCDSEFQPANYHHSQKLMENQKYYGKFHKIPTQSYDKFRTLQWSLTFLAPNQCALTQAKFTYRASYETGYQGWRPVFSVNVNLLNTTDCIKPEYHVCMAIHFEGLSTYIDQLTITGGLVIDISLPKNTKFVNLEYPGRVGYGVCNANATLPCSVKVGYSNNVAFFFNGFSAKDHYQKPVNERCATVSLRSLYYTEQSEPALIRAYDYDRVYSETREKLNLPDCRKAWNIDERPVALHSGMASLIQTPCPHCSALHFHAQLIAADLRRTVCKKNGDIVVFNSVGSAFSFGDKSTIYTTRMGSRSNYWNTYVQLPKSDCECNLPEGVEHILVYSDAPFSYYSGDSIYNFSTLTPTQLITVLPFDRRSDQIVSLINELTKFAPNQICKPLGLAIRLVFSNLLTIP